MTFADVKHLRDLFEKYPGDENIRTVSIAATCLYNWMKAIYPIRIGFELYGKTAAQSAPQEEAKAETDPAHKEEVKEETVPQVEAKAEPTPNEEAKAEPTPTKEEEKVAPSAKKGKPATSK